MSTIEQKEPKIVWHLVFTKAKHRHWLIKYLHPEFQHVYAMKKSPGDQFWLIVNPAHSHLDIDLESTEIFPTVRDYAGDSAHILTVHTKIDHFLHNKHLCFITCTDVVKALLGIRHILCFTPYQLYKNITGGRYVRCVETRRERSAPRSEATTGSIGRTTPQRTT